MDGRFSYNLINCICLANGTLQDIIDNFRIKNSGDAYILYYISSGCGRFTVNGVCYMLSKGQSVLVFPFSSLEIESDENMPIICNWVKFKGLEAAWMVSQTAFSKKNPVVDKMPMTEFERFFNILNVNNNHNYTQCRASGKVIVLLSFYLEYFPCKSTENKDYAFIARNYIEHNYNNPDFGVKAVADYVKIDRTYLYRLFKEETGLSVIDYINNCRITKAIALLMNENISVKDIAFSVGFTDQMYFSRVFKKNKGKTPTEFRREQLALRSIKNS